MSQFNSTIKIDVTPEGVALSGSNGQISVKTLFLSDENAGLLVTSPGPILLKQLSLLMWFQSCRCYFRF